jgi:hypothetical protein
MLNALPVIVAWRIVTVVVPVLLSVKVWGLLEPAATLPKFKLVALSARVPGVPELDLPDVEPAPVRPTHPEMDRATNVAMSNAKKPIDMRLLSAA